MYKNETIQVLRKKLVNFSEPGSEINTLNSTTQNLEVIREILINLVIKRTCVAENISEKKRQIEEESLQYLSQRVNIPKKSTNRKIGKIYEVKNGKLILNMWEVTKSFN